MCLRSLALLTALGGALAAPSSSRRRKQDGGQPHSLAAAAASRRRRAVINTPPRPSKPPRRDRRPDGRAAALRRAGRRGRPRLVQRDARLPSGVPALRRHSRRRRRHSDAAEIVGRRRTSAGRGGPGLSAARGHRSRSQRWTAGVVRLKRIAKPVRMDKMQNQDRRARSPLGRLRYFDGATTRELNGLKYLHATIDDSQIGRHLSGACAGDVPRRRLKSCVAATADDPRGGRDVRRDRGRSARQDP